MIHHDKLFFNITKGPSKFDLMASLFDGTMNSPRAVEFTLEGSRFTISVAINMVQQEDGSGAKWNFSGRVMGYPGHFNLKGHLSTTTRSGHIQFEIPSHKVLRNGEYDNVIDRAGARALEEFVAFLRERVSTLR